MKLKVLVVRDIKANVYGQPFYAATTGAAIRNFGDQCLSGDPNNMLTKHPEDFELYKLGEYDDEHASFELHTPEQIAVGSSYVKQ